jgi:hypothetical protein
MLEDRLSDQMVVGIGQNEKAYESSPKHKLRMKLSTKVVLLTLSSISIDHNICKIKGKLTKMTNKKFHKNNKLKAYITLYIKKADSRVKRKLAVEAAL